MSLKPAIKHNGTLHTGKANDSHISLMTSKGLNFVPEQSKGFSPDGKLFLSRKHALNWIRVHQPNILKTILKNVDDDGLHSSVYAAALGIKQVKLEDPKPSVLPDVSKMTAIVYDYGYHTYVADRIAREYGKVLYYRPDWRGFFPTRDKQKVGHGFDNYERILKFWDYADKADIIIFPGMYDADLQDKLRRDGHTVFGSGRSEVTEIDKWLFKHILLSGTGQEDKELLKEYGLDGISVNLPCVETTKVVGLDNLKEFLKGKKDLFITPRFTTDRGDMETKHFEDEEKFKTVLRELSFEVEYEEEDKQFLVISKIESDCESGWDEFQIDGQSSPYLTMGNENKDESYICKAIKLEDLPEPLEKIRSAMAQVYNRLGCRGNHSTEVRFDKGGTGYFIDDTERIGQPPGEAWSELWEDYGANMYQVATGELPTMKPVKPCAAMINLHSAWLVDKWVPVKYPESIAQWVKLRNNTIINGNEFCIPFDKEKTLGAIVGLGDSAEEAKDLCIEHLKEFWAHDLYAKEESFDKVLEYMKAGEAYDIKL